MWPAVLFSALWGTRCEDQPLPWWRCQRKNTGRHYTDSAHLMGSTARSRDLGRIYIQWVEFPFYSEPSFLREGFQDQIIYYHPDTHKQSKAHNSPCQASTVCEPWTSRCSSQTLKRHRNQRPNCQHLLDHWKSKRVPEKHLLLLYWLC